MFNKRLLALLTCFVMIFSMIIPTFANNMVDVVGTEYESAVGKLNALGIIEGYEDGTFRAENEITRAEFAKIACYLIGVQSAADLSKGATKFSDVAAEHWASGYINIAAEKGLIKGYEDGTFRPSSNVTYAEAVTILVRAMGLGPLVEGKGTWPSNYMAKASQVGITDCIKGFTGKDAATRGNIAKICWEALIAEKWGETGYSETGVEYGPLGKSILEEKYADFTNENGKSKYYEDALVSETALVADMDTNKITIEKENIGLDLGNSDSNDSTTQKLAVSDVNVYDLLGKRVNVLFGKDNNIVFIEVIKGSTVEGLIDEIILKEAGDSHNGKVEVNGVVYPLAKQAKLYLNTKDVSATGTADEKDTNIGADGANDGLDYVKEIIGDSLAQVSLAINKNGKVTTMNIIMADENDLVGVTTKQFVIGEITAKSAVKDVKSETEQFKIDDIEDKEEVNNNKAFIIKNGEQVDGSKLAVGDVVTYIKNGDIYLVIASDKTVTGTISNVASDKVATDGALRYKLTLGGKVYKMTMDGNALMSRTDKLKDAEVITSGMKDFYDKDATLHLNALGSVMLVSGGVESTSNTHYGIVTRSPWEATPNKDGDVLSYIKIKLLSGSEKTFELDGEKFKVLNNANSTLETAVATDISAIAPAVGTFVQFKTESDGSIKTTKLIAFTEEAEEGYSVKENTLEDYILVSNALTAVNKDSKMMTVGGVNYYADDDTIIINRNVDSIERLSWNQVVDGNTLANTILDNSENNITLVYSKTGRIVSAIIVNIDSEDYLNNVENYAIFNEIRTNSDGDDVIVLNVKGEEKQYVMAEDLNASIEQGDLIKYDLNGNNEFIGASAAESLISDVSALANAKAITDKVYSVNLANRLITFYASGDNVEADRITERVAEDVIIYDVSDTENIKVLDLDDLSSDMYIDLQDIEDGMAQIIIIYK